MENIMKQLHSLMQARFSAICSCFGNDIATIINNHMPVLFDLNNNYLYYHYHPLDIYNFNNSYRVKLKPTTTLNNLSCSQRHSISASKYTNLRLRVKPIKLAYVL